MTPLEILQSIRNRTGSARVTGLTEEQIQTYGEIGGTPHLDGNYTVFGEVIEGWEVVEAIGAVETGFSDSLNATDVPVTPVILKSATLLEP